MDFVTSIEAHRARRRRSRDDLDGEQAGADDPIAAVSDHTRALLARGRREHRAWLVPRALLLADLLGLTLAYLLATLIRKGHGTLGSPRELVAFAVTLPCWVLVAHVHGLYERDRERTDHSTADDVVAVSELVALGILMLLVVSQLLGRQAPKFYGLTLLWLLAVCIVPLLRLVAREACKHTLAYEQNAVIVGGGDVGQRIARKLVRHPEYGVNLVGFVDRRPKPRRADLPEELAILGPPERLREIVAQLDVERVVIAFSNEREAELLTVLRQLHDLPVHIDLVPRLFDLAGPRVNVHWVEGLPLLGLPPARATWAARKLKRAIDVAGAGIALTLLAPLFLYVAVRIRLDSEGPVLFRQERVGAGMKRFVAFKFRTMKVDTSDSAHRAYIARTMSPEAVTEAGGMYKLDRSDSVTSFGRWLRRTSLDELPQLINVLRGDMSLVGPRPCIPYELESFKPHHMTRFAVPQGITGLWQVTARASSTFGESLEMDLAYVRGWSLGLDLRLLLRTPRQVLRQRSSTA